MNPSVQQSERGRSSRSLSWAKRVIPYLCIYAGLALLVTLFQRRLIYHPTVMGAEAAETRAREEGLERWSDAAGKPIGWRRLAKGGTPVGSVLITHGNGGCAVHRGHYAEALQAVMAVDVFLLEYPGYGDRPGSPGERGIFAAAEAAFGLLPANTRVFLLGESLGSGAAAHLAGRFPERVAGMLLIAPFDRLGSVAQRQMPIFPTRWMLRDRFDNAAALKRYDGRLAVWLAPEDEVVAAKFGRRLFEGYTGPKRVWEMPATGHNELPFQPKEVWEEVAEFWERH